MPRRNTVSKHIHTYQFQRDLKPARDASHYEIVGVWICSDSNCNHYLPSGYEDTIVGRKSFCYECDKSFELTIESINDAFRVARESNERIQIVCPLCDRCAGRVNQVEIIEPSQIETKQIEWDCSECGRAHPIDVKCF